MKENNRMLAPFRWLGMAAIMAPLAIIGALAAITIGSYCLIRWKDPRDLR